MDLKLMLLVSTLQYGTLLFLTAPTTAALIILATVLLLFFALLYCYAGLAISNSYH